MPKTLDEMYACATSEAERANITEMLFGSAADVIDRYLPDKEKHGALRGMLAFLAVNSTFRGPYTPGSAAALAWGAAVPDENTVLTKKLKGGIGVLTEHLEKQYADAGGDLRLRSEVTAIDVADGRVTGLLGRNGAGKSTLMRIVAGQEFAWVFSARTHRRGKALWFEFFREQRRVGVYYFYVADPDFGPGFIKICTYFPYPAKVWVNGHEWAKRQAGHEHLEFSALANGFASCGDPAALQAICDRFGPADVQAFFDRWVAVIPTPFTPGDRAAGYWWELSMRQVEVSRTIVFDDPRRARGFFEALVADNIGIGRPEQVAVVFARQVRRSRDHLFRTRVFGPGTDVKMDFSYKHSRVKQYLKEGRALRIETVINKPRDISVLARLEHLPELVAKARAVNSRLLMIERAGQGCAIGSALFERIHQPYVWEGQRTGALRFGDQRAMALAGALVVWVNAVAGFTNKSLRGLVAGLLGRDYTASQMTYDLRRLRLHGLIERVPRTNTYVLTPDGVRVAVFYLKLQNRLLRPLLAADQPPAPIELRRALTTIDATITDYVTNARLGTAA